MNSSFICAILKFKMAATVIQTKLAINSIVLAYRGVDLLLSLDDSHYTKGRAMHCNAAFLHLHLSVASHLVQGGAQNYEKTI